MKFAADFGILELNADPALPVTVRNVEPQLAGSVVEVKEGNKTISPEEIVDRERVGKIINTDRQNPPTLCKAKSCTSLPIGPTRFGSGLKGCPTTQMTKIRAVNPSWPARARSLYQKLSIPKLQGGQEFRSCRHSLEETGFLCCGD